MGGAPVLIAPSSAFLALVLAASWYPVLADATAAAGPVTTAVTMAATVLGTALSVAVHELAHGAAGTLLGRRPLLYELYLWGGRTHFGAPTRTWTAWKDAVTSLAGPAANAVGWLAGRNLSSWADAAAWPLAVSLTVWVLTWVNLALAVFNVLPALPLDGGHALAAVVAAATGRDRVGRLAAAWGGVAVTVVVAWRWVARPLLAGYRPDGTALILVVLVLWPIATTSWRVLRAGRRTRPRRSPGHLPRSGGGWPADRWGR